jgi:uncharacterized membrane protein YtjA (UPF0391 family)
VPPERSLGNRRRTQASYKVRWRRREILMLRWAVGFFLVAIVAAMLGFGGIAGDAAVLAKICFLIFLVLAVVSLVFGRGRIA